METHFIIIAQILLLSAASSQFYFDTFHNRSFDRHISNGLDTLDRVERNINRIAEKSRKMIDDHRRSISQLMSGPSMLDDIARGFGPHMPSRAFGSNLKVNAKNNAAPKPSFEKFDLMALPGAKPIFPVKKKPVRNSLEMIMGRLRPKEFLSARESNTGGKRELNLKQNLRKWRLTSRHGHKTSAMTRSMSVRGQAPGSGRPRARNYVMGFSREKKDLRIDLNTLLDRLESDPKRAEPMMPQNVEISFKDGNGRSIEPASFGRSMPEEQSEIFSAQAGDLNKKIQDKKKSGKFGWQW